MPKPTKSNEPSYFDAEGLAELVGQKPAAVAEALAEAGIHPSHSLPGETRMYPAADAGRALELIQRNLLQGMAPLPGGVAESVAEVHALIDARQQFLHPTHPHTHTSPNATQPRVRAIPSKPESKHRRSAGRGRRRRRHGEHQGENPARNAVRAINHAH